VVQSAACLGRTTIARPPPCLHGAPGSAWSLPARGRRSREAWPPALPLLLCEQRRQSVRLQYQSGTGRFECDSPSNRNALFHMCVCVFQCLSTVRGDLLFNFRICGVFIAAQGRIVVMPPSQTAYLPIPKASSNFILHYKSNDRKHESQMR
jgi:hypothetical protein